MSKTVLDKRLVSNTRQMIDVLKSFIDASGDTNYIGLSGDSCLSQLSVSLIEETLSDGSTVRDIDISYKQ